MPHPLRLTGAVTAALLVHASLALADPAPQSSSDGASGTDASSECRDKTQETTVIVTRATPLTLAVVETPAAPDVEMYGVHYRPRYRTFRSSSRRPESAGVSQIHAGV